MFEGIITDIANFVVQISGIFVISALGVLVGFPIVQLGNHWGKILGDDEFKSKGVLFFGFLVSIFFVGVFFELATPFVNSILATYIAWIPSVIAVLILLLFAWFCKSFDFKPSWKIVIVPVL